MKPADTVKNSDVVTIPGLDTMTASNASGRTRITLQFSLSRLIDSAALDVQAASAEVLRELPPGILANASD